MLLPSPTNLSPLFVAGPQLLGVVSVMQWAVQHLPALGHVPLLEGCAVCVPAQVRSIYESPGSTRHSCQLG
jgi:hypothetical protein